MGAVRRMADGGNAVGAVPFPECPTPAGHRIFWVPAATSVTADAVFRRTPADHLAGSTDPGAQVGNRRTAYAGREALCKDGSERVEVAGVSPGPSTFT